MEQIVNSRRNFLKLLGLATAATIIPVDKLIIPEVSPNIPLPRVPVPNQQLIAGWYKVTREMMDDIPFLQHIIRERCLKLSNNDPNWESKTKISVGYHEDDFIKNLTTLRFDYDPNKV